MKFLDANIFLRALVEPEDPRDEAKARACRALFERVASGDEVVTTSETVIAEVVFVLGSPRQYRLPADEIATRLRPLLELDGLRLPLKRRCLRALDIYHAYPRLGFDDALIVAHLEDRELTDRFYSYDTDFDRIPGVARSEP